MSRIGRKPVPIPVGVTVEKRPGGAVAVKGPKGELQVVLRPEIDVAIEDGAIQVRTGATVRTWIAPSSIATSVSGRSTTWSSPLGPLTATAPPGRFSTVTPTGMGTGFLPMRDMAQVT